MPRTIEGIVASHQAAAERRAAGRPIWDRKIDVRHIWRNEDMSFPERRDAVVAVLHASSWLTTNPDGSERDMFDPLVEAVDGLADAEDPDEFDGWWDEIYDIADAERVWISTTI